MDKNIPEIVAARLVIPDAAGTPRIVLGLDDRGEPSVRLFDRNGNQRAFLALSSERENATGQDPVTRAHFRLAASDEQTLIDLTAFEGGYGTIELTNDPETFAHVLLEVEKHEGGRQASLVLGDRKARTEFLVRDGSAEFGSQSG